MEKISQIVRGSARVASVDLKNAAPLRAGTPSFGRPVSESTGPIDRSMTTAQKAVAIQKEMQDTRNTAHNDRTVQGLADSFFMSRVRRPDEQQVAAAEGAVEVKSPVVPKVSVRAAEEIDDGMEAIPAEEVLEAKYTPRGSYVNVRA